MKELQYIGIVILSIAFIAFLIAGFNKLHVYENPSSDDEYAFLSDEEAEAKNAYVGGDAYNYIINAGQATAYFVLAGFSLLSAIALGILVELVRRRKEETQTIVSGDGSTNIQLS